MRIARLRALRIDKRRLPLADVPRACTDDQRRIADGYARISPSRLEEVRGDFDSLRDSRATRISR